MMMMMMMMMLMIMMIMMMMLTLMLMIVKLSFELHHQDVVDKVDKVVDKDDAVMLML